MSLAKAVPALFMIALAGAIVLGTGNLRFWDGTTPGARFLPIWLAAAGLLLGVLLLVALWRGRDGGVIEFPDRAGALRVGLAMLALVAMPIAAPVLGMVPTVAVVMMVLLSVVLRQRLVPSLVTTAIVALGIELVFVRLLAVPLPSPFG